MFSLKTFETKITISSGFCKRYNNCSLVKEWPLMHFHCVMDFFPHEYFTIFTSVLYTEIVSIYWISIVNEVIKNVMEVVLRTFQNCCTQVYKWKRNFNQIDILIWYLSTKTIQFVSLWSGTPITLKYVCYSKKCTT